MMCIFWMGNYAVGLCPHVHKSRFPGKIVLAFSRISENDMQDTGRTAAHGVTA